MSKMTEMHKGQTLYVGFGAMEKRLMELDK